MSLFTQLDFEGALSFLFFSPQIFIGYLVLTMKSTSEGPFQVKKRLELALGPRFLAKHRQFNSWLSLVSILETTQSRSWTEVEHHVRQQLVDYLPGYARRGNKRRKHEFFKSLSNWMNIIEESPVEVRNSGLGLGLFLKHRVRLNPGQGFPLPPAELVLLSTLQGNTLQDRGGYPSLLEVGSKLKPQTAIVYGPCALVNHACDSCLYFTKKGKLVFKPEEPRYLTLEPGQQLLVNYCPSKALWFSCACSSCTQKNS